MFLRTRISYALIAICVFFHDLFGPPYLSPEPRIAHNLTAVVGFTFVVYVIQRYLKQREELDSTVRRQRDQLRQDVELATQVQRMPATEAAFYVNSEELAGQVEEDFSAVLRRMEEAAGFDAIRPDVVTK